MKGRSASSSTLLLLLNAFWQHESPSQRERGRATHRESERSDNDFLLHRIWMCPTSVQIDIKLRAHAPAHQECSHVSPSGRPSICPARTGRMNNGPRTIVTNLFCFVFSRARNIPSSELLAMDEEQKTNNSGDCVL